MRLLLCLFILSVFGACTRPVTEQGAVPRFEIARKPPVMPNKETPYTFGYLTVPESRDRANGRQLKLPVYRFQSRSANPAPDPVVLTFGGPGSSSLSAAAYMKYYRYLDDRDLILFEQRGTRYARPHLACPEWGQVSDQLAGTQASAEEWNAAYVAAATACRDRLEKTGVDLNAYRTLAIAQDIEDLRKALKLEKINLLTTSYSTKIAQVMMREFPDGLRSVVMDSALPLAASWGASSSTNLMELLGQIFRDCADNPDCAAAYPDLEERFTDYLKTLNERPVVVRVGDREPQKTFTFSAVEVIELLSGISTGEVPGIPRQMAALMAGDISLLEDQARQLAGGGSTGEGMGMRLSVWCAEETAFTTPAAVKEERNKHDLLRDRSPLVFSYEVCRSWGVDAAAARENVPVKSDVPVLFITGTYDAITPPKWAEEMSKTLPNSHQLNFPGWTHGPITNWSNPCAMEAANAFFNAPTKKPDLPCYADLPQPVAFE
ncbi:alpha/beta hydrolase [Lewinella sp. W8]|uniref:alpha/beta hydrolase n=1 Tax=Lewinella sp. W8 TaxID=2528208 RepID=UPI0010685F2F|nr:alpha/beta fold hydrolase [Lewinella sp. W8]MTB53288.1 alpha/beta fold hydrolase [Lewinella sp. W8]